MIIYRLAFQAQLLFLIGTTRAEGNAIYVYQELSP